MGTKEAIKAGWEAYFDAIREADFLAEEIALLPVDDPQGRKPGLIAAWHEACRRRDQALAHVRDLTRQP